MTRGFSFKNPQLFVHRKYYRAWIERTLMTAYDLLPGTGEKLIILKFKDHIDPLAVRDDGCIPCATFQREEGLSCLKNKMACLFVLIRDLIQHWWECSEEHPGRIEPLLIELDRVIEAWRQEEVVGNVRIGYHLQEKI